MNPSLESQQQVTSASRSDKPLKPKKESYRYFFISWIILIILGVAGSILYTQYLKQQITKEIAAQTEQQLQVVQADYQKQLNQLKDNLTADIAKMQTKVDTLNELLAFTKDNANSKTDNSNQLYTQLAEVKAKLDELKKNLDVLK